MKKLRNLAYFPSFGLNRLHQLGHPQVDELDRVLVGVVTGDGFVLQHFLVNLLLLGKLLLALPGDLLRSAVGGVEVGVGAAVLSSSPLEHWVSAHEPSVALVQALVEELLCGLLCS